MEEAKYAIAQANVALDARGRFTDEIISCRKGGDFVLLPPDRIEFMDVSPKQLVSVAAPDVGIVGPAQVRRPLRDGEHDRLEIRRRARDDTQDLSGCRLLL